MFFMFNYLIPLTLKIFYIVHFVFLLDALDNIILRKEHYFFIKSIELKLLHRSKFTERL